MIQSCTYLTHAQYHRIIKDGKDLEDQTQRRGLRSKFRYEASLNKQHQGMATFQPYGLGHYQVALWPPALLKCLPVASSAHKCNSLQARWPRSDPMAGVAAADKVPPIHLDGSRKHLIPFRKQVGTSKTGLSTCSGLCLLWVVFKAGGIDE